MPLDSFMDQTDIGINILNTSNTGKGNSPLIPVTLSLPFEPVRAKLPQFQQRKAVSMPTTSQVNYRSNIFRANIMLYNNLM